MRIKSIGTLGGCTEHRVPFMCEWVVKKKRIRPNDKGIHSKGSKIHTCFIYTLLTVMLLFVVIAHIYKLLYYMLIIIEQIEQILE